MPQVRSKCSLMLSTSMWMSCVKPGVWRMLIAPSRPTRSAWCMHLMMPGRVGRNARKISRLLLAPTGRWRWWQQSALQGRAWDTRSSLLTPSWASRRAPPQTFSCRARIRSRTSWSFVQMRRRRCSRPCRLATQRTCLQIFSGASRAYRRPWSPHMSNTRRT